MAVAVSRTWETSSLLAKKFSSNSICLLCRFSSSFGKYEKVLPAKVSPIRNVPTNIPIPQFKNVATPQIRSINDLVRMRQTCQTARKILDYATQLVQIGVTTDHIDKAAHDHCLLLGVYPSPLGYKGFPKSICTSVNNVVCHGIPDERPLQDGDIINLDITIFQNGFHGDCSRTVLVGCVDDQGVALVEATEASLAAGVSVCADGVPFNLIGETIEEEAARRGFKVIPNVAGHGIGHYFHEPPDIYHVGGLPDLGVMREGMTFTVEPALTQGEEDIITLKDGWTVVTADGARSAQAEHTILVTGSGAEVLTVGRKW